METPQQATHAVTPTLNIHQRMLGVMKDISYVQKSTKPGFMYKFVTHDAVTALVRGALLTHGIVATTDVVKHVQDGNRTEVDVRVEFVNVDNPQDRVTVNAFGYGIDPQDKGPGKAISYAVKYAYLKAFALETGDDPENDSIDHKTGEITAKPNGAGYEKHTARQVAVDAFDQQSPEEQAWLKEQAIEIIAIAEGNGNLHSHIEAQRYDTEQKLALWSLLPSNVRSSIKKSQQAARLGSQA